MEKGGEDVLFFTLFISKKERNLYLNTIFLIKLTTDFDVIELCKLL
jgi:hypothetical protein